MCRFQTVRPTLKLESPTCCAHCTGALRALGIAGYSPSARPSRDHFVDVAAHKIEERHCPCSFPRSERPSFGRVLSKRTRGALKTGAVHESKESHAQGRDVG